MVGVLAAVDGFDPARGTGFEPYATRYALGEMLALARQAAAVHVSRTGRDLAGAVEAAAGELTAETRRGADASGEIAARAGLDEEQVVTGLRARRALAPPKGGEQEFLEAHGGYEDAIEQVERRLDLGRAPARARRALAARRRAAVRARALARPRSPSAWGSRRCTSPGCCAPRSSGCGAAEPRLGRRGVDPGGAVGRAGRDPHPRRRGELGPDRPERDPGLRPAAGTTHSGASRSASTRSQSAPDVDRGRGRARSPRAGCASRARPPPARAGSRSPLRSGWLVWQSRPGAVVRAHGARGRALVAGDAGGGRRARSAGRTRAARAARNAAAAAALPRSSTPRITKATGRPSPGVVQHRQRVHAHADAGGVHPGQADHPGRGQDDARPGVAVDAQDRLGAVHELGQVHVLRQHRRATVLRRRPPAGCMRAAASPER